MSNDKLREALAVLESATSFSSKKARDGHARACQALRDAIAAIEAEKAQPAPEPAHWLAVLAKDQRQMQPRADWHAMGFRSKRSAEGFIAEQLDFKGWRYTLEPLYFAAGRANAQPLTAMQARHIVGGMGWDIDQQEQEDMEMLVKATERACAEAWGVKLSGITEQKGGA